jgi:hypothetical protein
LKDEYPTGIDLKAEDPTGVDVNVKVEYSIGEDICKG